MNPAISDIGIRTLDIKRTPLVVNIDNPCLEQLKNGVSIVFPTREFGVLGLNLKYDKA